MVEPNPRLRRFSSFTRRLLAPMNDDEEILIVNPDEFRRKLAAIVSGGAENIQIVSDFDFTLSRREVNNIKGASSFTILQKGVLDEEGVKKVHEMYEYYHKIEVDPNYPQEEKAQKMIEWWERGCNMIIEANVYQDMMPDLVSKSVLYLRNGIDRVFYMCEKHDIPFTIVSAGCGNVIDTSVKCLTQYKNIDTYSNYMEWDDTQKLVSFSRPMLMSHNKNTCLRNKPVKPNVILMGDMPSDVRIVEFCEFTECLKIGFINDINVYDLEDFKKYFDVLVMHDGNLTILEMILAKVLGEDFNAELFPSLGEVAECLP